jgi:HPt (histidine-containing phosphotransfer) domain-containing protein
MSTQPVIDRSTYENLQESMGTDFMDELLQAYFDETPQLLSSLRQALDGEDCETFQRSAHSIKSTSNSFGALQFGTMARELEMMGKDKNLHGAPEMVDALVAAYEDVKKALEGLSHGK